MFISVEPHHSAAGNLLAYREDGKVLNRTLAKHHLLDRERVPDAAPSFSTLGGEAMAARKLKPKVSP